MTVKALQTMGCDFLVVIEKQEYAQYASVIDEKHLLVLDESYKEKYDTCDDLGLTKSVGPGAARNFIWDHSIANGHKWHWTMDDNIRSFQRLNHNNKNRVRTGAFFRVMEDFCDRYENVAMAGPNYAMFAPRKKKKNPLTFNTRIYSCNLIRNDVPFRWRGRYNEDTILSLDMLKRGWCTIQFNAFLQEKMNTQKVKGGNTAEFYAKEGTMPKSAMQVKVHPDVSKIVFKFGRWHHHVDYRRFRSNKLKLKKSVEIPDEPNEYGMELKKIPKGGRGC